MKDFHKNLSKLFFTISMVLAERTATRPCFLESGVQAGPADSAAGVEVVLFSGIWKVTVKSFSVFLRRDCKAFAVAKFGKVLDGNFIVNENDKGTAICHFFGFFLCVYNWEWAGHSSCIKCFSFHVIPPTIYIVFLN